MRSNKHCISSFLVAFGLAGAATGCNPLVFGDLVDNAPVRPFTIDPPTAGNPYGRKGFRLPGGPGTDGSMVLVSDGIPLMSRIFVGVGGDGQSTHPSLTQLQAIMGPLSDFDTSTFGGAARVPAPIAANVNPHAVVGITSTFEPWLARVVRIDLEDFDRTDMFDQDIESPRIAGAFVSGFGRDVAAINLDGPQDDAAYEVAVGSSQGLLIFDSVGANTADYLAAREAIIAMNINAFTGDDEPNGFHFTHCDQLLDYISLGAGNFGSGGAPAFVASTQGGLTLIADQGVTNAVGAPIYDCSSAFLPNASPPSPTFGWTLFTTDVDGDGNDDLFVGDPESNRVDVYMGNGNGLPTSPTFSITPPLDEDGVAEFGFSVDRANLGGGFGEAIVIGAPGTALERAANVGAVFVYRINEMGMLDTEAPIALVDQSPTAGTRHGLWAGGIRNDENDREELVVIGATEGRVHLMIDDLDPSNL